MQFQAICSKANKKLTISLTADNIQEARKILHSQGYSIMELTELQYTQVDPTEKSNFFYFDINLNGQIKTGKIQSDDVFKSYKKLIEDLGYDVIYIYTNEGMNEEQKKVITAKVRDSYRMYKQSLGEAVDVKKETEKEIENRGISPALLRQIEQYSMVVDSTLEKIQNLILKYHNTIPLDKKKDLESIMHMLLQAKSSSNVGKIKMNVESALKDIGEIELELVKTGKDEEKKKFLLETNALLKQIGSTDRIQTKETQDIGKSISDIFSRFKKKEAPEKKDGKKIDTHSFIFFKNQRELDTYKKIHEKNDFTIIKSILTFQWKKIKRLLLKRKLLRQNIQIIDNRINNRNISYTKIVHGAQYYVDIFINALQYISRTGAYILFFYILSLLLLRISADFGFVEFDFQNNKSILYITLFSLSILLFSFIRSVWAFILSLPLMYMIFVFISINF